MHKNDTNLSLLTLLIGVSILLFFVFAPFLPVLALAGVFAILLHQPFENLSKLFGGSRSLAALSTVLLMLVFVIVPLFFLGIQISQEAQHLYSGVQGSETEYLRTLQAASQEFFPNLNINIKTYIENGLIFIAEHLGSFLYQTLFLLFTTFLMLLALFYFLKDGRSLLRSLRDRSPFGRDVTNRILDALYDTTRSVVRGTLLIVLIRWLCIWAAFWAFGIPNTLLWSSVGGVLGAVPGLGTAFGFVGAVLYLYLAGNALGALLLALVGAVTVVVIDNLLTSYFFGKGLEVPSIFVLFSILGGIFFFGPLGFIFGPLVLSVFLSVLRAYEDTEGDIDR
ncbi:MAG: hypothetical protein JWN18_460 [Parcubacteria group bacterium]|nr:hypothetical protein [Parcubacteria group bacterium]